MVRILLILGGLLVGLGLGIDPAQAGKAGTTQVIIFSDSPTEEPAPITSPALFPAAIVTPPSNLKTPAPAAVTTMTIPLPATVVPPSNPPTEAPAAASTTVLEIFPRPAEVQNGYLDDDGRPDTIFLGIKGRLLDRQTGRPIEALLTITKDSVSEILKTLKGVWIWKSAVPGSYALKLEAEGYQPRSLDFFLLPGQEIILDLRLEPLTSIK